MSAPPEYRRRIAGALSDKSATALFGGENALTVNDDALEAAKRMQREGASRDEIWRQTGERFGQPWFEERGKWWFETPGSAPEPGLGRARLIAGEEVPSSSVYTDPGTDEAYPELANTTHRLGRPGEMPRWAHAHVLPEPAVANPVIVNAEGTDRRYKGDVFLHERQHQIDALEEHPALYDRRDRRRPWERQQIERRAQNAAIRQALMAPSERMRLPPWATEDAIMKWSSDGLAARSRPPYLDGRSVGGRVNHWLDGRMPEWARRRVRTQERQ